MICVDSASTKHFQLPIQSFLADFTQSFKAMRPVAVNSLDKRLFLDHEKHKFRCFYTPENICMKDAYYMMKNTQYLFEIFNKV